MGYLTFFINRIALEADTSAAMDFYNSEEHAGTSYLPFIGFMLFLAGIVVIIVGLATLCLMMKKPDLIMKNLLKIRRRER
mgnify:CR=1 FL=1